MNKSRVRAKPKSKGKKSPTTHSRGPLATSLKKQKMGHKNKTYIIFDGDNDKWAYANMKGWKALEHIDFDFENAHDEYPLTSNASDESYIKGKLRKRFANACQVIVLIGESTKNLYKYVRWELEVAQSLGLPIIAVNLNGDRAQNNDTCPPIIRDTYTVH